MPLRLPEDSCGCAPTPRLPASSGYAAGSGWPSASRGPNRRTGSPASTRRSSRSASPAVSELDRKIVRGSAWLALSFGGSQVASLVTTAVIAHFLTPSAFGLVALAALAIAVVTTVQESGLGLAIIHKRDDLERAAGTALVFSVLMGFVLYAVAF